MADEQKLRRLSVKSADPTKVGIWEEHPEHPDGQARAFGEQVVIVAATPMVLDALARGLIVEVGEAPGRGAATERQPSEGKPASAAIGGDAPSDVARGKR